MLIFLSSTKTEKSFMLATKQENNQMDFVDAFRHGIHFRYWFDPGKGKSADAYADEFSHLVWKATEQGAALFAENPTYVVATKHELHKNTEDVKVFLFLDSFREEDGVALFRVMVRIPNVFLVDTKDGTMNMWGPDLILDPEGTKVVCKDCSYDISIENGILTAATENPPQKLFHADISALVKQFSLLKSKSKIMNYKI